MKVVSAHLAVVWSYLQQGRYAFELLLERRLWLFLAADVFILFMGIFEVLVEGAEGGRLNEFYPKIVIVPNLLIGLPALSTVVALERRAGSLDLALAVPSTERYFIRRIVPVCTFLILQGWLVLAMVGEGWNLARAFFQSAELSLLLGALVLFWAVRLKTSGAVLAASLLSVALLSKWIFFTPYISRHGGVADTFLGIPLPVLSWCWNVTVLALAAVILFQYARERLRRPETMLA